MDIFLYFHHGGESFFWSNSDTNIKIKVIFSGNLEIDPSLEIRYGRVWQLLFENHIAWFPLLFNIADDDKDDDELFLWYG